MPSEREPPFPSDEDRACVMASEELSVLLRTAAETDPVSAQGTVAALLASPLFDLNRSSPT